MLTVLKGLPLTYNSDLQEDKEHVFDVLDALKPALDLLAKFWPKLRFDAKRMRAASGGFALATDLAEYLVGRGTTFREAHEIVGAIVRETSEAGKTLEDLSIDELRRHSSAFGADAVAMLRAENSVARRTIEGGPGPSRASRGV